MPERLQVTKNALKTFTSPFMDQMQLAHRISNFCSLKNNPLLVYIVSNRYQPAVSRPSASHQPAVSHQTGMNLSSASR